jgi:hypothetical protein
MLHYLVDNNGNRRRSLDEALKLAAQTWAVGMETAEHAGQAEGEEAKREEIDTVKVLKENLKARHVEAAVLDRTRPASSKFRLLDEKEIRSVLKDL